MMDNTGKIVKAESVSTSVKQYEEVVKENVYGNPAQKAVLQKAKELEELDLRAKNRLFYFIRDVISFTFGFGRKYTSFYARINDKIVNFIKNKINQYYSALLKKINPLAWLIEQKNRILKYLNIINNINELFFILKIGFSSLLTIIQKSAEIAVKAVVDYISKKINPKNYINTQFAKALSLLDSSEKKVTEKAEEYTNNIKKIKKEIPKKEEVLKANNSKKYIENITTMNKYDNIDAQINNERKNMNIEIEMEYDRRNKNVVTNNDSKKNMPENNITKIYVHNKNIQETCNQLLPNSLENVYLKPNDIEDYETARAICVIAYYNGREKPTLQERKAVFFETIYEIVKNIINPNGVDMTIEEKENEVRKLFNKLGKQHSSVLSLYELHLELYGKNSKINIFGIKINI